MTKLIGCAARTSCLIVTTLALLLGCSKKDPAPAAVTDPRDAWVGTWAGVNNCQTPPCGASPLQSNSSNITVSITKSPSSSLQIVMIITTSTANGNVSSSPYTGTVVASQASFTVNSGSLSATLNGSSLTLLDQSHSFTCTVNGQTSIMFNQCSSTLSLSSGAGSPANSTNTTLTFNNTAFTPVSVVIGADTKIVQPGATVVFSGSKGAAAIGSASTSGTTTTGTQVGLKISWNINTTFPSSGNTTTNLDVNGDLFFVKLTNVSAKQIVKIYSNYGLSDQTLDNLSIPNNGTEYSIGYYKAFSNSNVRAEAADGTFWTWNSSTLALTFKNNQVVSLKAN